MAPFFNQSNEPTVDGRRIALAYFNELQLVPGFEVVPVEVVEKAMLDHRINMRGPAMPGCWPKSSASTRWWSGQ